MKTFTDAYNNTFTNADMVSRIRSLPDVQNGDHLVIQRLLFESWEGAKRYQYNRVSIRTTGKSREHIVKVMRSKKEADQLVDTFKQELNSKKTSPNHQTLYDEADSLYPMTV